ncbi:hypothetical protein [Streptomyces sp. NPDC059008]|uniref:hypothetical protein n=1 Tax=Streptomyces sp. NPDC059008 TaxID=3346693 RepID=UPI00368815BC
MLRKYTWNGYAAAEPLSLSAEFDVPTSPEPLDKISDHFHAFPDWYESPHDIAPIPATRNFYVTTDVKVVEFDVTGDQGKGQFGPAPEEISGLFEVKGLGIHPQSHQITLLRHDLANDGWSSDHVEFYRPNGRRTVGWKGFYKARWVENDPTWTATFPRKGKVQMDKIDAALLHNGNPRFFGGASYVELDWSSGDRVGYTREISEVWPGLPADLHSGIDAVFLGPDGDPRFIKGDRYVQCRWDDGSFVEDLKLSEVWPGLPPEIQNDVDAVFLGPDGDPRFFKGGKYVQCKWSDGSRVGFTREISEVWPGLPADLHSGIDAVFLGPDGDPRFIKGDRYIQCRWDDGSFVEDLNVFEVWPGLKS